MTLRIYTDTSVLGGCFDEEFIEWSNQLIDEFMEGKYIMVISDVTLQELEEAPKKVKDIVNKIPKDNTEYVTLNDEAKLLSQKYIAEGVVGEKYLVDAQHIAIATVNRTDVLVSWNFRHIVNLNRIRLYNSVNLKYGYSMLEIRSPREVL